MQATKVTWRMRKQCVSGLLSSSPAREPGNEANTAAATQSAKFLNTCCLCMLLLHGGRSVSTHHRKLDKGVTSHLRKTNSAESKTVNHDNKMAAFQVPSPECFKFTRVFNWPE